MYEPQNSQVVESLGSSAVLRQGSSQDFVQELCSEAFEHRAVRHPYLERLASGDLPDMGSALRDFCHQYNAYCQGFPSYLEAVIGGLQSPSHRELLRQNLAEEQGQEPGQPKDLSHRQLFQRFCRAAGVTREFEDRTPPCTTATIWHDQFLRICKSREPGVGLGAIGIGTELIVSTIYGHLHRAVVNHSDLSSDDYLFLTLHIDCDDGHGEVTKAISVELAEDYGQREALRFGALTALDFRCRFWDAMLARAVRP